MPIPGFETIGTERLTPRSKRETSLYIGALGKMPCVGDCPNTKVDAKRGTRGNRSFFGALKMERIETVRASGSERKVRELRLEGTGDATNLERAIDHLEVVFDSPPQETEH